MVEKKEPWVVIRVCEEFALLGLLAFLDDTVGLQRKKLFRSFSPIVRLCAESEECEMSEFSATLLLQLLLVSLLACLRAEPQHARPMYD
jgi:hypothetical protein